MNFQTDPEVGNYCCSILLLEVLRYLFLQGTHKKSLAQCGEAEVMTFFHWWILMPSPCFPVILLEI